jgi:hypothetical protein
MTKRWSTVNDNDGLCESCNRPDTIHQRQEAYPLTMAGDHGPVSGTMWLCPTCLKEHRERDVKKVSP